MKQTIFSIFLFLTFTNANSVTHEFGAGGVWGIGGGQGYREYSIIVSKDSRLDISCPEYPESDSEVATFFLLVKGAGYGADSDDPKGGFNLIIDGVEIQSPYDKEKNKSINGWELLRNAKSLQAKTGDGKILNIPTKGINGIREKNKVGFLCTKN